MPTQKRLIEVPCAFGLDQKVTVRNLEAGKAAQLFNARMVKRMSIRKRFGHTALSKADTYGQQLQLANKVATVTSANAGASYKGVPLLLGTPTNITGTAGAPNIAALAWSDAQQAWSVVGAGLDFSIADQLFVGGFQGNIYDVSFAQASGYTFVALTADYTGQASGASTSVLYAGVFDATTGAVVMPMLALTAAQGCKVLIVNGVAVIVYVSTSQSHAFSIAAYTMTVANIGTNSGFWAGPTTLKTDGCCNYQAGAGNVATFDAAAVVNDSTRFALAYPNGTWNVSISANVVTYNSSLAVQRTTSVSLGNTTCQSIAVRVNNTETCWCAFQAPSNSGAATAIKAFAFTDPSGSASALFTLTVLSTGVTRTTAVGGKLALERIDATHAAVAWSPPGTPSSTSPILTSSFVEVDQLAFGAGAITQPNNSVQINGVLLNGAPIATNGIAYLPVYVPSTFQGTQYLAALDWWGSNPSSTVVPPHRVAATFAPRLWKQIPAAGGADWPNASSFPNPGSVGCFRPIVSGSSLIVPAFWSQAQNHQGLTLQTVMANGPNYCHSAEVGDQLLLSAATPCIFDGQNLVEAGFPYYPEVSAPTTAGGSIPAGSYSYIFIYEWYDQRGYVHWSQVSPPISVALTSASQVTFNLPVLGLTAKGGYLPSLPSVVTSWIGAVVTNSSAVGIVPYRTQNGGTTYFRASNDPSPAALLNVTTSGPSVSWTDNQTDSAIGGNQQLYTTGGVPSMVFPEGKSAAIQHLGRWWLAGGGNAAAVWPSQAVNPGTTPGFNEALNFYATGAVKAMASMDQNLALFVQRGTLYGIEIMTGYGPTNIGTQTDYPPIPTPVPTGGIGAKDQRSVAYVPEGVFFFSPVGGPNGGGGFFMLTRAFEVKYIGSAVEDTVAANPVCTSAVAHPNGGYIYFTMVPTDTGFSSGVRLCFDYIQGVWSVDQLGDPDAPSTAQGARWGWVANTPSGLAYHWLSLTGRVYRETAGTGAGSYLDAGQWVTWTYQSAPLKPGMSQFARFWRLQVLIDSKDAANLATSLTFDYQPQSVYSEPQSFTAGNFQSASRYPQSDVELIPLAQTSRAIQVTLTDAPPTGGPLAATGQGFELSGFLLELGVDGGRWPGIPTAFRG